MNHVHTLFTTRLKSRITTASQSESDSGPNREQHPCSRQVPSSGDGFVLGEGFKGDAGAGADLGFVSGSPSV